MEGESPFIPEEQPQPKEVVTPPSDTQQAADFLRGMYSESAVRYYRDHLLAKAYDWGFVERVREIDHRISSVEAKRRMADILEKRVASSSERKEERTEFEKYFIEDRITAMSDGMNEIVDRNKERILESITSREEIKILYETQRRFFSSMGSASVDPYRITQFLHDESIPGLVKLKNNSNEGHSVNRARFNEALEVVLSAEHPDIRDLEFFMDIISNKKNKYVRSIALKKAVDIFRSYPDMIESYQVEGKSVHPSISELYEDLFNRGLRMPKRDFLFTIPFIMKDGIIQEDLLQTAIKTHKLMNLRDGAPAENIYYSSLVDLYNPNEPASLHPLFELLQAEVVYLNSDYYTKVFEPKIRERTRRKENEKDVIPEKRLSFAELRKIHQAMLQSEKYQQWHETVIKESDPETYENIQSMSEEERLIELSKSFTFRQIRLHKQEAILEKKDPSLYEEIKELPEKDRQAFIKSYFKDIWNELSQEERDEYESTFTTLREDVRSSRDRLWVNELNEEIKELEKKELSCIKGFEELLKKLSAINAVDPDSLADFFTAPHESLEECNHSADSLQLKLFESLFEITPSEAQILRKISKFTYPTELSKQHDALEKLYKEFGNFNPFFFLLNRYQHLDDDLKPVTFHDNLVPLLKECVDHIVKGDFEKWRSSLRTDIDGKVFIPWEVRGYNSDSTSSPEALRSVKILGNWIMDHESEFIITDMPPLSEQVESINPELTARVNDSGTYLSSMELWKKHRFLHVVTGGSDNLQDASTHAKEFLESMSEDDPDKRKSVISEKGYSISHKDTAGIIQARKLATSIIALQNLSEKIVAMKEAGFPEISRQEYEEYCQLMETIKPSENLISKRQAKGDMELELTALYCKALETIFRRGFFDNDQISVKDSSQPFDLLTIGQPVETLINCMSYEGDPHKSAFVLDIATSWNKKVILVEKPLEKKIETDRNADENTLEEPTEEILVSDSNATEGNTKNEPKKEEQVKKRTIVRAVLKLLTLQGDSSQPVIVIEDIIAEDLKYKDQMFAHLQKKYRGLDVIFGEPEYVQPNKRNEIEKQISDGEEDELIIAKHGGSRVGAELMELGYMNQPEEMTNSKLRNDRRFVRKVKEKSRSPLATGMKRLIRGGQQSSLSQ